MKNTEGSKLETILRENMELKQKIENIIETVKQNAIIQRGFRVVEQTFLLSDTLEEIDDKALQGLKDVFEYDNVTLFLDERKLGKLKKDEYIYKNIIYTDAKTLKYAYLNKRPYFGKHINDLISEFRTIDNIGSYVIAPIVHDDQVIGSLNIYSTSPDRISDEANPDLINEFLVSVKIALFRLKDIQTMIIQTRYDSLTRIYNKGMMETLLKNAMDDYEELGEAFTFLMLDLDNFKKLNDSYGHIAGDEFLRLMAFNFKRRLGEDEFIGRFGGDEFYLILKESDEEVLKSRFKMLVDIVKILAKNYEGLENMLSISAGFARVPHEYPFTSDKAITELVKIADTGLYHSKTFGNKISNGKLN